AGLERRAAAGRGGAPAALLTDGRRFARTRHALPWPPRSSMMPRSVPTTAEGSPSRPTTETTDQLRRNLAALRLGRPAGPPRRRRQWPRVAGAVAVALAVLVGYRAMHATAPTVEVAEATVPATGGDGVPVLSGAGYVVSADRYISIG